MSLGGLRRVIAPARAVDLTIAKAHLKVEHDDDDEIIKAYLDAAIEDLDGPGGYLGRALAPQTWDLTLDGFPDDDVAIELPLPPLIEVEAVFYQASAGVETELDASAYVVAGVGDRVRAGRVGLTATGTWPRTETLANAVRVRFRAGFIDPSDSPAAGADLPPTIRAAIFLRLGDLYRNRGSSSVGDLVENFPWTKGLLRRWRYYLGAA